MNNLSKEHTNRLAEIREFFTDNVLGAIFIKRYFEQNADRIAVGKSMAITIHEFIDGTLEANEADVHGAMNWLDVEEFIQYGMNGQGVREQYMLSSTGMRDTIALDVAGEWRDAAGDNHSPFIVEFVHMTLQTPAQGYTVVCQTPRGQLRFAQSFPRYGEAVNVVSDALGEGFVAAALRATMNAEKLPYTWNATTSEMQVWSIENRAEILA